MRRTEHKKTVADSQSRTETGQTKREVRRLPKSHVDYWVSRLRKRSYQHKGKTFVVPDWQVRLQHLGREEWFNLATANQAAAAAKAKSIYGFLQANGWEPTLAKFKAQDGAIKRDGVTIGDYLRAVESSGELNPKTFLSYQNAMHTIVAGAFGIRGGTSKFDYKGGGNQKWRERLNAVHLMRLSPEKINGWKRSFITQAGKSPAAIASAKRTVNSYIRCARSLFSEKLRGELKGIAVPESLPFDGVSLEEAGSSKYVSRINAQTLLVAAKNDLKANDPEAYKIFLLGLCAGMRKAEIDLCEWGMFDWEKSVIRMVETEWLHLKTHDSAAEITVDPEVMQEIKEFMPLSKSPFVVTSGRPPRNDAVRTYYRCEAIFHRLNQWLRSKGVKASKPLHELRKEIGAVIATEHGIFAASRFLRHSDITTTARHYADQKTRISVGLGKLLNTELSVKSTNADERSEATN